MRTRIQKRRAISNSNSFDIFHGGSITGTFAGLPNGSRLNLTSGRGSFQVTYTATDVILSDWWPDSASNVTFAQRTDGSKLVDVYYTWSGGSSSVALAVLYDGGSTFNSVSSLSGDVGASISAGTGKHIVWNAGADYPSSGSSNVKMRVTALLYGAGGTFAPISAGTYQIGNVTGDSDITNAPVTYVALSAYSMAVNDTTKAQWDAVRSWGLTYGYTDLAVGSGKASNHPVQTVNWYDVVKWANAASEMDGLTPCYTVNSTVYRTGNSDSVTCDWGANGYRLPTEAEWEAAARGGLIGKRFPWGDTISQSQANYYSYPWNYYMLSWETDNGSGFNPLYATGSVPFTSPVGSFPANGYGLNDLVGNVWQWCWDVYSETYAGGMDPRGADTGRFRVMRGGGYGTGALCQRLAWRGADELSRQSIDKGFRMCKKLSSGLGGGSMSSGGVVDTTAPALTLPANVTAPATSTSGAMVSYAAAMATDNVTASPVIAYSKASGTVFPLGKTSVTVTATDAAGNVSRGTFNVTVSTGVVNSKLSAVIYGSMQQLLFQPADIDPAGYTVSNLPPGVFLNGITGVLSGSPTQAGTYAVSISGNTPGALPLNFEMNVAAVDPGLVGVFQGWIERNNSLNKNLGSTVQITTTAKGLYTGKLSTGGVATAFRGCFIVSPASSASAQQTARILCILPKTSLTLDVLLDSAGNVLSGTLRDDSGNTADVSGWRNVWPTTPGNADAFKGLHTFYLQQLNDPDENVPQGSGFGSLMVSGRSGVSFITASLADGAKMTSATFVGPNGEGFVYGSLYTNLGSVLGRLDIETDNNVSGNPTWMRPDLSAKPALTYRLGFGPTELSARGGLYVPPGRGELILGLSPGAENAQLVFSSGGLSDGISQTVTVTSLGSTSVSNRITVPLNINQVRVSGLSVSTGEFSGSFLLLGASVADAARRANFYGQLVQTPGGALNGYGYFLLPKPPAGGQTMTTAPKLSGSLLLSAP